MNRQTIPRLTRVGFALLASLFLVPTVHRNTIADSQSPKSVAADEPFAAGALIEPDQLAGTLSQSKEKPPVICVGVKVLYEGAHVPGALYLGPARTADGLDTLHKWAENLSREKMILFIAAVVPGKSARIFVQLIPSCRKWASRISRSCISTRTSQMIGSPRDFQLIKRREIYRL